MRLAMNAALWTVSVCLASACGRIAFEPQHHADGGTTALDVAPPMLDCADMDLGSALGANVASGSTSGAGNDLTSCGGMGPELSFAWVAPATASYTIDTCASDFTYDTVLSVHDGSCTGPSLACNSDACGLSGLLSRVTVSLQQGQGVVIVVDGANIVVGGNYQLAITQM
jgi:hypothetical protein